MTPFGSTHVVSPRYAFARPWAVCFAVLASLWPGYAAFAGQSSNGGENGYSYYHFKSPCRLKLDASRIAVLRAPNVGNAFPAEPDLSSYGIDMSTVEPMAVRGWSFVRTDVSIRTDATITRAVSRIASAEPVEFVSPVFLDDEGGPIVITRDILVGFDRSIDPARAEAILGESQAGEILNRDWANMQRTYRLRSALRDGFEVLEAANALARRPEVIFAEPNMMVTVHGEVFPNDSYFPSLWGLHNDGTFNLPCTLSDFDMDVPEAWDITTGNSSILVAVLDSGVQLDHPDLNLYTPGFDATGQGGSGGPVNACDNHGTWVAGCVSGIMNNNLGIVGVAPGVRSAPARVFVSNLACNNSFTQADSWVVDALAWAEGIGARITNSSWGRSVRSSAIDQKFADTRAIGMVHFAAAGNSASSTIGYPASLPSVNAVAALDPCGNRAVFSNYGVGLDFSAPGHFGISTDRTGTAGGNDGVADGGCLPSGTLGCSSDGDCGPGETCFLVSVDYALVAGTSFASPYTAGVAALVLSVNPSLPADQLEALLQQTTVDLGPAGYDTDYGWGFVNAFDALNAVVSVADERPPFGPGEFALRNTPNPFVGKTKIGYDLARGSTVQLRILDVSGRIVRTIPPHFETAGSHAFLWDATDETGARLPPGMYFCELRVNGTSQTRKAVLMH